MRFEDFIESSKVIVATKDLQKAKALIKMAEQNIAFVEMLPEKEEGASVVLSQSYESLRQILEAITLNEGYKVYSHEAYTSYLKKLGKESVAQRFDRLRKLRNGVNYYGKAISLPVAIAAKKDVRELMTVLKKEFLKGV